VLLAAVAGGALLFRRQRRLALAVLLAPIVLASVAAVGTYGLLRLRHVAEISLVVLAGIAVAHLAARTSVRPRPRRRRGATPA
jgi:hypothetical protein